MRTSGQYRTLKHNFGTFNGFNFRDGRAIERDLTGEDVLWWEHDLEGEAEFWPTGDHFGLKAVCGGRNSVTALELRALDRLLTKVGDDSECTFLRIRYATTLLGLSLHRLTALEIQTQDVKIFIGSSFLEIRKTAAHELFKTFVPRHCRSWETNKLGAWKFDRQLRIGVPFWSIRELNLGDRKVVFVAPR